MPYQVIARHQGRPRLATSLLLFSALAGAMAVVRLVVFPDRVINLTYGLPLLVCLWYPSRCLLWCLTGAFVAISTIKTLLLLPRYTPAAPVALGHWLMESVNTLVIAAAIWLILNLLERQRGDVERLEQSNRTLQSQAEELAQQAEEIQLQAGLLQQQTSELELANIELSNRQSMLENLLHTLPDLGTEDGTAPRRICESALALFAQDAVAATVVLRDGAEFVVQGAAGRIDPQPGRWTADRLLANLAVQERRPQAVPDLRLRPDITVPSSDEIPFRSLLAAPLWLGGEPAGALEFYARQPHEWTREHVQIAEWAAAQCSLILEARRLHERLAAANADLERQVGARTRELEALVNDLEHFSYTITHDLRAPLRAMQGYSAILQEEHAAALDAIGRDYLHRIATAASRMDQLITDALSYSRAVRQSLPLVPVDPTKLLRGMIESYPMFQPPQSRVEIQGNLPAVMANEAGLTQCFSNLLGNAVKFVAPGTVPVIRVRADRRDGAVRLWVEDNGIGIEPAMQPRLFNMFQRLHREYEGTGIGLALVRKVTERMGGRVGVESEAGRGSRFWLELHAAS